MASILVTGGTGFVGSYIAKTLLAEGHKVVCFDNFIDPSRQKFIGENAILQRGDVTRIEEIISVVKEYHVEKIISLAFLMPLEAEKNLQLAAHINILGVNNVFETARLCGIKRVVYSSSISGYGHVSCYGDKPAREVPEDFYPANNVYGAAKQFNEFMAGRYNEYHHMEIVCIRVSVVFGYGRTRGSTVWVDNMISNPVRGVPAHVPRRSSQKVNLIYVKDLAEIFSNVVMAPKLNHRIYNSGRFTVSLGEFSEIVKRHIPNADFTFDEDAPPFYLVHNVDDSRMRKEFKLKYNSFEDNILDQILIVRKEE
jgi:UDP-glucose 4-epimerase